MFNYNKELIVNDINNVIALPETESFLIKRGAEYKMANIYGAKIIKTRGNKGECAVAEIDVTKLLPTVDYHQFLIFIKTTSKEYVEYALANWHEFGKPVIVETSHKDAQDVAIALNLALPNDNPLYKAESSGTTVKITLAEPWMEFDEIRISAHKPTAYNPELMVEITEDDMVTITPNVEEFATANWIVENLRFPTTANLRYNRLYADESPVAGTIYTEYAFQYFIERATPGGVSGIGQKVDSITGHVIYVPQGLESDFETKLGETGWSVNEVADADLTTDTNKKVLELSK